MIVAFVPEGLPLALTVGLTIIARRLCSKYFVLVKQLGTVESEFNVYMGFRYSWECVESEHGSRTVPYSSRLRSCDYYSCTQACCFHYYMHMRKYIAIGIRAMLLQYWGPRPPSLVL